jgi:hypothetical protein
VLYENTGSYTPDFASEIDLPEEITADEYGVDIKTARRILKDREGAVRHHQAEILGAIIGQLLAGNNLPVKVHSLAIAFGFDQLNGFHSQSEIARELGVTRALVSHYVLGWRDVLDGGIGAFENRTFRKRNSTRKTYAKAATNPVIQAKLQAKRKK